MLEVISLPEGLIKAIGSESKDFAVEASHAKPVKNSLGMIIFGVLWLAFTSIFVITFIGPLLRGKEVEFTSNGVPVVAGPGNLEPITLPAVIIGIFALAGVGLLAIGLYSLFKQAFQLFYEGELVQSSNKGIVLLLTCNLLPVANHLRSEVICFQPIFSSTS